MEGERAEDGYEWFCYFRFFETMFGGEKLGVFFCSLILLFLVYCVVKIGVVFFLEWF